MSSVDFPFAGNTNTSLNDLGIGTAYPGVEYGGTETNALYYEDREISGTLYRVQNATFNKFSQKWLLVNTSLPAYAMALASSGAWQMLTSPANTSPFTTWTVLSAQSNGTFTGNVVGNVTGSASIIPATVDSSGLGIYNVKKYGAKGDGVTDDTAAIKAAIAAAQLNGSGAVFFPAGSFVISSILTISASFVGLVGLGKNVSKIITSTAGISAVQFVGTAPGAALHNNFIRGLGIYQNNITGSGVGLLFNYTQVAVAEDLQISGFFVGVQLQRATNTVCEKIIATFNPTSQISGAIGFNLVGNQVSGDTVNQGNASSVFRDCVVDMSAGSGVYANVSTNGVGYKIFGTYCGDYQFENCDTSWAYTGYNIDLSGVTSALSVGGGGGNDDIIIVNPTLDFYTNQGIFINGISAATVDNLSEVTLIGGWFDPYNAAVGVIGIQFNATRGGSVTGTQFYTSTPNSAANQVGVNITSSSNVTIAGCQFVAQKNGIVTISATDVQIIGNRFYNDSHSVSTLHANITGSTRVGFVGNVFDGFVTNFAVQFDATSVSCLAIGNTINGANMAAPLINVAAGATGCHVAQNIGYNPVGKLGAQPAVPASTVAYTNNSGVDCTHNIFTGAGVTVSAIAIGGQATSLSMAASSQLQVFVPAGQSITLTYAGGTPTWSVFGN